MCRFSLSWLNRLLSTCYRLAISTSGPLAADLPVGHGNRQSVAVRLVSGEKAPLSRSGRAPRRNGIPIHGATGEFRELAAGEALTPWPPLPILGEGELRARGNLALRVLASSIIHD